MWQIACRHQLALLLQSFVRHRAPEKLRPFCHFGCTQQLSMHARFSRKAVLHACAASKSCWCSREHKWDAALSDCTFWGAQLGMPVLLASDWRHALRSLWAHGLLLTLLLFHLYMMWTSVVLDERIIPKPPT